MVLNEKRNSYGLDLASNKPVLSISIVAEILNIHQRTLRIYDEINLLKPSRASNNRRLYSMEDVEKGKFILHLIKDLGINLSGAKIILHLLENQYESVNEYKRFIESVADKLNITEEIQQQNRIKLSKRGRKKQILKN